MVGYADENTAIRTLFNTGWGATTQIAYENEKFVPTAGTAFVSLHIRPDGSSQIELGDSNGVHFRHPGLIFVMIFTPPDQGNNAALVLADQAADIFRRQTSTFANGKISYRAPNVEPLGITDEGYFQVNVVIPYTRDSYHV